MRISELIGTLRQIVREEGDLKLAMSSDQEGNSITPGGPDIGFLMMDFDSEWFDSYNLDEFENEVEEEYRDEYQKVLVLWP